MQIYLRFLDGITIIDDNETEICKIDFILDMIKKITDASRDQIKISCDCEGVCRFSPYKERRDARSRHPFKDGDVFNVVITPLFNIRYADIEKDVVKYYLKNGSNISDDQYHDKLV